MTNPINWGSLEILTSHIRKHRKNFKVVDVKDISLLLLAKTNPVMDTCSEYTNRLFMQLTVSIGSLRKPRLEAQLR